MKSLLYLFLFFGLVFTEVFASPGESPDASITRRATAFRGFGVVSSRETNGQRMARGLGPRKPTRLFSPTRARRDPLPSAEPTITIKIKLVKKSDGSEVGYMRTSYDPISPNEEGGSQFFIDSPFEAAQTAKFEVMYDGSTETNFAGRRLALGASSSTDIGSGLLRHLYFWSPWTSVPEGSPPVKDGGVGVYFETTIWSVDTATGVLSAEWVNPDGSRYPAQFFVYDESGTIYPAATGDIQTYQAEYPDFNMQEVTLVAIPVVVPPTTDES